MIVVDLPTFARAEVIYRAPVYGVQRVQRDLQIIRDLLVAQLWRKQRLHVYVTAALRDNAEVEVPDEGGTAENLWARRRDRRKRPHERGHARRLPQPGRGAWGDAARVTHCGIRGLPGGVVHSRTVRHRLRGSGAAGRGSILVVHLAPELGGGARVSLPDILFPRLRLRGLFRVHQRQGEQEQEQRQRQQHGGKFLYRVQSCPVLRMGLKEKRGERSVGGTEGSKEDEGLD